MALKLPMRFPIFAPAILSPNPAPNHPRSPMEVRFARWNNANADKFNERRRTLQEIEDNIRRERRFDSADRIARYSEPDAGAGDSFKSAGTPSFPSNPSIPGKKSKYSRNPNPNPNPNAHPAFRPVRRGSRTPIRVTEKPVTINRKADVRVGEDGVSYVIDGAPFEFKYSYTETPKVKPVKLRETPYAPFGPTTMARPWTGRAPLPASTKKLKEFDSFRLPPPHKKGVKPVQAPGPFVAGSGPKYVMSREEIIGEPLTEEEVNELVEGCKRTRRQMNMGRDGLTHNMLDNIHAHWKRRRVCKIKCKGVCTVDMENVRQQLEERTGGKIIYSKGGVLFLFRGRNYNYRTRPRFPLMLWKPITPVYPRLVKQVPEGLTMEEVSQMRRKGHQLQPICKLGKNGFYNDLIKLVREAFEECELVRINCQGMNGSDYRKIGAKLKDLVPCVLLSFAYEHILIWRGRDWKSALPTLDPVFKDTKESGISDTSTPTQSSEGQEVTAHGITVENESPEALNPVSEISATQSSLKDATESDSSVFINVWPETEPDSSKTEVRSVNVGSDDGILKENLEMNSDSVEEDLLTNEIHQITSELRQEVDQPAALTSPCTEGVLSLLKEALESGSAIVLDDSDLESDIIYQKTVDFSKSAPPGPVFRHRFRKVRINVTEVEGNEKQESEDLEPKSIMSPYVKERGGKRDSKSNSTSKSKKKDFGEHLEILVPQGSLRVDELAKLLA